MKVQSINVNIGRKIVHEGNDHSIEIGLQVTLDPEEDPESVYYSVKSSLEGQLDTWEHEIRTNDRPMIIPEMTVTETPPLITASEIKPKISKKTQSTKVTVQALKIKEPEYKPENDSNKADYICPTCGEQMVPKEGKDYYLCSKHWGYPDMILKGMVKDRKF